MQDKAVPLSDTEIAAFVHDELDGPDRLRLTAHLARHPDAAAAVMTELAVLEGLRLAVDEIADPPPLPLRDTALRLGASLQPPAGPTGLLARMQSPLKAGVLLGGLFLTGLIGGAVWLGPLSHTARASTDLAETALDALAAIEAGQGLSFGARDPQRIATRLGLPLPDLPPGWQIRAAEVVATPNSPAMALTLDTPVMGEVMLLSVPRTAGEKPLAARTFAYRGSAVAVFQREAVSYVLLDRAGLPAGDTTAEVAAGAKELARRFN